MILYVPLGFIIQSSSCKIRGKCSVKYIFLCKELSHFINGKILHSIRNFTFFTCTIVCCIGRNTSVCITILINITARYNCFGKFVLCIIIISTSYFWIIEIHMSNLLIMITGCFVSIIRIYFIKDLLVSLSLVLHNTFTSYKIQ